MPLKLYKMDLSPPACAAMMICEIHNVPVEMIDLNLLEKEQLKPEYLNKNPMHSVPMLEDDTDSLFIHDSHVILTYITDKYGKDDTLYPKDLKKRALVDQKLYFDTLLFNRVKSISFPALFEGVRQVPEKPRNALLECYDFLETFLTKTKFIAGDNITIADVSIVPTVAAASYIVPIDDKKYPKLQAWFSNMEKQPFYQKRTAAGTMQLKEVLQKCLDQ
ncbi:glutathione S-transferase 1-like [Pararge aegeria]|uniref:glutathione S-transferase 1-like n=1 Tax=Pararge aegeria TaxID=116150 RepID=UPI0019D0F7E2|nr:glutathione S-transferase 1-like [Pararge aegeria]